MITPEEYARRVAERVQRYEVAECNDGYWGIRDNTTGSLVSDETGHIVFKFEHNARLMCRVINDRA